MFNKNGYTLVEVLAVLILLAIIFTIAAPRMLDSIDESKKSAFKVSANTIMDQLQKSYAKGEIEVPSSGKLFVIENNAFVGDSINVRGTLPDSGSIHLSENGEIAFSLYKEDYCAVKDIGQDTITVSNNFAACIINIPQPVSQDCFSRVDDGVQVTITDYDYTCSKNVIIPDILDGLPVRIIGDSAFAYNSLLSVSIPKSVTVLLDQAFYGNQLTSLSIPESITDMGVSAFGRNILENITIPSKIKTIKELVFANNQLKNITIPDSIESISFGSFGSNPLESINIGSGFIGFQYSSGTSETANKNAFSNTNNLSITISDSNNNFVALDGGSNTIDMKKKVFGSPSVLSNIPSSSEIFVKLAFSNMNFSNITLPSNIKTIEIDAFAVGTATSVSFPTGLITIGDYAFRTNQLTNIVIPNTVKSVGSYSFWDNKIISVSIPSSVNAIGMAAFNNNLLPNNQAIIYGRNPDGSENSSKIVSYGGIEKDNVIIPSGVTTLSPASFQFNNIKTISIPNTVTKIEYNAFGSNELTTIVIPNSVTSIGSGAFRGNSLNNVNLGTGLISIADDAFATNQLTTIVIPNSVTSIGARGFAYNTITNVTIPANVTIYGDTVSSTFHVAYVTNNAKAAGTYTAPTQTGTWTKQ